jgi:hypothetical protein
MKLGTAHHRLRTKVMFWLAQKCGMAKCFRCNRAIRSEGDFSIDHKEPWINVGTEKYWDLGNIAFAHKSCNYSAHRKNPDRTSHSAKFRMQYGPDGTAWCGGHRAYLPRDQFSLNGKRWNGLQDVCRECRSRARSPKKNP